jgi:capsular polysaccharide transport system permease protein
VTTSSLMISSGARKAQALRGAFIFLFGMLPSLVASFYLAFIAAPQFASETSFVVRSASKPVGAGGGLSSFLALMGVSQSRDDAFIIQDFLTSRSAVSELEQTVGLRRAYSRPSFDPILSFPSWWVGSSDEHLWRYFRRMTEVIYNAHTGVTSVSVRAFDPETARSIALQLLRLGERTINQLNQRILDDAVRVAALEVTRAEERVLEAQSAIGSFRNREMTLDPGRSSVLLIEVIGRLNSELSSARAQLAEVRAQSPNSPNILSLTRRIEALAGQIVDERQRATSGGDNLAQQIGEFDRLNLQREFANRALTVALQSLQLARIEARRQQLFLERISEPSIPDYARYPQTARWIATNLTLNLIAFMIAWLVYVGAREHKRGLQVRRRA